MRKIHFIGVGGIGMSALAQMLAGQGVEIVGTDREASPVTELLERKGIKVVIGQKAENVEEGTTELVYSDAVPAENSERAEAARRGIPQLSYFGMLGEVSKGMRTVAVAGTKGKTTATSMLAKILIDAGVAPTAIIGSLVKDFGSNYASGSSNFLVVEACEYRDHLLELAPEVLVITNLEWDHTDWFPSIEALQNTFRTAIQNVPAHGAIITNPQDPHIAPLLSAAKAPVIDYTKEAAYELNLPGEFNKMNARAAAAAARAVLPSITESVIAASLASFQGIWRRFEYKGKTVGGADVYDDYAHHPMAVEVTLKALRAQTKGKVIVAFHPHLYSRTRDLFNDFAHAFKDADKVLLAPIYAAREVDDGSISSAMLADALRANGVDAVSLPSFEAIRQELKQYGPGDVIMTMGAGDIYKVADALVKP